MSQNLSSHTHSGNGATAAENSSVQLALRLRPSDRSDRAVVSNVSAVYAASGMVFVDFGFIEQQAIDEVTRALRAGSQTAGTIDGRLECRVAMGVADVTQLMRQLQQVLAAASRQSAPAGFDADINLEPDASLQ